MACCSIPSRNEVLDFVGGRKDLAAKIIRTIGEPEQRFGEDKLRMLRAVRFAARFDYTIEPATMAAIQKLASQIHQVSRERVRDELTKMLTEGHARRAFLLLDESNLLREVLPEIASYERRGAAAAVSSRGRRLRAHAVAARKSAAALPAHAGLGRAACTMSASRRRFACADRIRFDGHVDVGVKMAEEIFQRLRFSNDDTEQILALVENHMRFAHAMRMNESTFKKFVRMPRFDEHLELHRLDCLASHGTLESYNFTREKMAAIPPEAVRPKPLLSGDDLIAAGYAPGPRFKEILGAVEDAQLEGRIANQEEAMQLVRREYPR